MNPITSTGTLITIPNSGFFSCCSKYFTPSLIITTIIESLEQKYAIEYENTCVLFYRGNDKNTETKICEYADYVKNANAILQENPECTFLIQSDETEFFDYFKTSYPTNSFHFTGEVDLIQKNQNHYYSKNYLAITIIISKCKYIICGSGNCSIWIMLYRGHTQNVYQNLLSSWITPS